MISIRLILVNVVLISWFFLTGFKQHLLKHESSTKHQQLKEVKKPLDLSVPQRELSFQGAQETITLVENASPQSQATAFERKVRALELQGNVIMTQEQEAGKTRSADGAGIMINLHH
jgi:uncharacterized protein YydD (DUF2326 family)